MISYIYIYLPVFNVLLVVVFLSLYIWTRLYSFLWFTLLIGSLGVIIKVKMSGIVV